MPPLNLSFHSKSFQAQIASTIKSEPQYSYKIVLIKTIYLEVIHFLHIWEHIAPLLGKAHKTRVPYEKTDENEYGHFYTSHFLIF